MFPDSAKVNLPKGETEMNNAPQQVIENVKPDLRSKISIQNILIFGISILILPTILVYSIANNIQIGNATEKSLQSTLPAAVEIASQAISSEIDKYTVAVQEVALESEVYNTEQSVEERSAYLDSKAELYGMYAAYSYDASGICLETGKSRASDSYFNRGLKGETVVGELVSDERVGQLAFSVYAPVWENGVRGSRVIGVVEGLVPQTVLNSLTDGINMSEHTLVSLIDKDGTVIAAGDAQAAVGAQNYIELAKAQPKYQTVAEIIKHAIAGETGCSQYKLDGEKKVISYAPVDGTDGWSVFLSAPEREFAVSSGKTMLTTIILALVFIGYACFGLAITIPRFVKPIVAIVADVEELAKGNFSYEGRKNGSVYKDVHKLNTAVNTLRKSTCSVIGDISYVLGEMATGDFTVTPKIPEMYVGDYGKILEAEKTIRSSLAQTISGIMEISEQVSGGSEQVSNGAQALAQGATEQASSVEELSATIGEVARQIEESAQNAEKANAITVETESIMRGGVEAMEQASAAMNEISETSRNISKVIKAIDDIAFQTNILALNAAVEAARAGSAGKGFAVVADEVRNLSQKSAEAAKNTTMLIESSMQAVEKGGKLVNKASEDFETVAAKSSEVTSIVGEITEQFQQQSVAAKQIALGIEQVASVVQINSATSEESAAASEELSSQANVLKNLVAQFKLED